jgi:Domain of unknown function (DUF5667)
MPDQGDPIWGPEERFAEAVEPGRPSGSPVDDDLVRDLEIAAMLRSLGPALSAGDDAKARIRARVMASLAVDGPPSNGGGSAAQVRLTAPDSTPTEQLSIIAPVEAAPREAAPAEDDQAAARTTVVSHRAESGPSTSVLTEPDVVRALRPGRRRRHALPSRPSARPSTAAPSIRRRVMAVGAAAMLAVIAIAGGGIFASRDSVPGDPLYAIKRAAEAASGIFTGGSASGAQRDLQLAATRLDEIQEMARESADPGLITSAFQDFDDATSEGSRLALSGTDKATTYADLSVWSTQQSARLAELRSALPASTEPAADDAARLLDRVHRRAGALAARSSCAQVSSGAVDDLGPIPATGACTVRQTSNGGTAATSDPAARRGTQSPSPQESTTRSSTQQDGSTDPAQVSGGQAGSPDDESGSTTTTTQAPASSKNAGLPLPLPLPVNVPQLLPGKLLG